MSALTVLALLGLAAFLPIMINDDENDDTETTELEEPVDPVEGAGSDDETDEDTSTDDIAAALTLSTSTGEILNGLEGNDTLTATGTSNGAILNGGEGDDFLSISGANGTANGDAGNDLIDVTGIDVVINGGEDDDSISVDGLNITANAGLGNDSIFSAEDNSNSILNGEDGDDQIDAAGTDISINGGNGDDQITYGAASGNAYGDEGNDTLSASPSDRGLSGSLFGNEGDDVLSAQDTFQAHRGVVLNGGEGSDQLTTSAIMDLRSTQTSQDTLIGGEGGDSFYIDLDFLDDDTPPGRIEIATIQDFNVDEDTLFYSTDATDPSGVAFAGLELNTADDGSYTEVIARYNSLTAGVEPTLAVVRLEGVNDLELNQISLTTGDTPTSGNDYISSGGGLGGDVATISAGAGDDLLFHEGRDDASPLTLEGGLGNDTLIADEVEFSNHTTLNGGAGDDLLVTQQFTNGADTIITGEGADTVEVSAFWAGQDGGYDAGTIAVVTDFTPGEDVIVIDTAPISISTGESFTQSVTLIENTEDNSTSVQFVVGNTGNADTFTGNIQLEGLTGLTEDDIAISLSDSTDRLAHLPSYLWTESSETRP